MRTLLTSVFVLMLVVTTISSIYLALEKKRLSENYNKDRELWTIKNKTLKDSLNRSEEEIEKLKAELTQIRQNLEKTTKELEDLKLSYEDLKKENFSLQQKIEDYSQEKTKLLAKITQLEKDLETARELGEGSQTQEEFWTRILREKVDLEMRVRELDDRLKNNRQLLQQLQTQRQSLESRLGQVEQQKMNLEKTLTAEEGERPKSGKDALAVRLEKENIENRLMEMAAEKETLSTKITALKLDLEQAQLEKENLTGQITKINQSLEERLREVNRVRKELELALEEAKRVALSGTLSSVELPPVVVQQENQIKEPLSSTIKFIPPQTKSAAIVLINEAHNFVILNIGKKDGVVEGMNFDVYENKEKIARVKIKEVRDRLSAAEILEVMQNKKIKTENTEAIYSP